MKILCHCYNAIEAHLLKGLLEQAGIDAALFGEALAGALGEVPVNEAQIRLCVKSDDLLRAQKIYNDFVTNQNVSSENIFCPRCREENPSAFEVCWNCESPID